MTTMNLYVTKHLSTCSKATHDIKNTVDAQVRQFRFVKPTFRFVKPTFRFVKPTSSVLAEKKNETVKNGPLLILRTDGDALSSGARGRGGSLRLLLAHLFCCGTTLCNCSKQHSVSDPTQAAQLAYERAHALVITRRSPPR